MKFIFSVTLIGIATGGLECDLELLLSSVNDAMIFCVGKKELENLKNIDQIKRDLRQCYPILDYLLESLDPNAVSSPLPTLLLDLIQSILCPQAHQLQVLFSFFYLTLTGMTITDLKSPLSYHSSKLSFVCCSTCYMPHC